MYTHDAPIFDDDALHQGGDAHRPPDANGGGVTDDFDRAAGSMAGLAAPAKIPEQLPRFILGNVAGVATPITSWAGKSLILNFWATWCAPCRREIPLLTALHGEWARRNVQVVGIAVDHREQVAAFANELHIPYPLLVGEQDALDVAAQFGIESPVFPFTVFTDRRGRVVALFVGELHRSQAELVLGVVQQVNAAQLTLPAARLSIADGLHALGRNPVG